MNRLAALVLTLAVLATGCVQAQNPVFPGQEWENADLGRYGWSVDGLQALHAFVRDSSNTTGLMVVDRGRVVTDWGDTQELSYLASVRKSILAMLYGKYVEEGTIDLDVTLEELAMDDILGLSDQEKQATIRHLITARSGVYHPASNAGDNSAEAPPRGSQEPGTYMLYNNWDFNAAGHAFELTTGRNIYDALESDLAVPLRFQDWDLGAQRKSGDTRRSRYQAYHMWLSTRDMARVGLLMLNDGVWDGQHILPEGWVHQITSVVTPRSEMNPPRRRDAEFAYGYMWWLWAGPEAVGPFEGAYVARGAWGQYILVMPAVDLVIAHKTKSAYGRTTEWGTFMSIVQTTLAARQTR